MIILNLFLISVIWVLVLDISGIVVSLKRFICKMLHISPNNAENLNFKPFDCSFCMTWWSGLIFLIIIHKISFLTITLTLLCSFFTTSTKNILYLVKDIIDWGINKISKLLS